MNNKHLLNVEQLLCINDSVVEWKPAKKGETLFGDPLFGVATDFSHRGMIIRNEERIKSVREVTEEEAKHFYDTRKSHDAYMRDYYENNSYTGD